MRRFGLLACIVFFQVIVFPHGPCWAKADEKRWSVAFEEVTVSEALNTLSQKTGVTIHATRVLDSRIQKRYQDKTIDQIVKDLLRNTSHSLVWSYGTKGEVASIYVWIFEKGKSIHSASRQAHFPTPMVLRERTPRGPRPVRPTPKREYPVHKEPTVGDGGSEPNDPPEEAQGNRPEPGAPDEDHDNPSEGQTEPAGG